MKWAFLVYATIITDSIPFPEHFISIFNQTKSTQTSPLYGDTTPHQLISSSCIRDMKKVIKCVVPVFSHLL